MPLDSQVDLKLTYMAKDSFTRREVTGTIALRPGELQFI